MMKSDQSKKDIVRAAIQRHVRNLESWRCTRLWDEGDPALKAELTAAHPLADGELAILYSYIDPANWTLVTTQRIRYSTEGQVGSVAPSDVLSHHPHNFKGYGGQEVEHLEVRSRDGRSHHCPFETGIASMGTIYAVRTLCQITPAA